MKTKFHFSNQQRFAELRRLPKPWTTTMREQGYQQVWVKFGDGQIEIVTNSKDAPKVIRYRA